jgi:hypothetical protein
MAGGAAGSSTGAGGSQAGAAGASAGSGGSGAGEGGAAGSGGSGVAGAGGAGGAPSACPLATDFWCDDTFAHDLKTGITWERDYFVDFQAVPLGCTQHFGFGWKPPTVAQWQGLSSNREGAFQDPDVSFDYVFYTNDLDMGVRVVWSVPLWKVVSGAQKTTVSRCVK